MANTHSAKPTGVWEVTRTIRIPGLSQEADALVIVRALDELSGVKKVSTDTHKRCVSVQYDASAVDYNSIVILLESAGFPALSGWWSRLKGNWYQFTDSNARENANLPTPPCCNKSPK